MTATCRTVPVASPEAMMALGRHLAAAVQAGSYISLNGPLAAGKTTFARGFVTALGHHGAVKSPTFTLVETYALATLTVHHFDLYRLNDAEELEFIGIEDYFDGDAVVLVEWPEHGAGILRDADVAVDITLRGSERDVSLVAAKPPFDEIVSNLKIV